MDEIDTGTVANASPAWRRDPSANDEEVRARRLSARTWMMFAILAALVGALLGLAGSFRLRPFPAFLPVVVADAEGSAGKSVAFAAADVEALALHGLFGRTIGVPAPLGPTETILGRLDRLNEVSELESVVVFLIAPARVGPGGAVEVLAAGANGYGPDRWINLRDLLAKVATCPARSRLVLLDLMRPSADAIRGILEDDIAARIGPAVDGAVRANQQLYVLSACAPGQHSWVSEERGRSVFGLAVEEGLRGLADSEEGNGDGLVTARELARYVTKRTRAWVRHNRQADQTPVLLEKGGAQDRPADFALAPRNRVVLKARREAVEPEPRTYPDWLKAAWEKRDGLIADGTGRQEARALRLLDAALQAAEQDWRAGVDPVQIRKRLDAESTKLLPRFGRVKSERTVPLRSLALGERQGRLPDPAVRAALAELLIKRAQPAFGLKPEEAATAEAKLLASFEAATKDTPDFDMAAAIFAAAADTLVPDPRTILFLDRLIQTRPGASFWVEIVSLRRLAERADMVQRGSLPATAWKPPTVRKLLNVVRQGERAHACFGAPDWIVRWLDEAALTRHLGEVAFDAFGYVPPDQADRYLDGAANRYASILAAHDRFQNAVRLRDEALELLPDFLPFLESAPELFPEWSESIQAARALDAAIADLPAGVKDSAGTGSENPGRAPRPEVLRAVSDRLDALSSRLRSPLDRLRRPFQKEAIEDLLAPIKEAKADGVTWRSIAALLAVPLLAADQRAAVWTAAHELAERLDASTPLDVTPARLVRAEGAGDRESGFGRSSGRRAAEALSLLKLAGLAADVVTGFDGEIQRHAQRSDTKIPSVPENLATGWPELGAKLHRAWSDLIDAQSKPPDLAARCRLARVLPSAILAPSMDLGRDDPLALSRKRTEDRLGGWLANWFEYVGIDQAIDFFLVAAEDYRLGVETPISRPSASWTGGVKPIEMGEDQSVAAIDLTLNFQPGSTGLGGERSLDSRADLPGVMARVIQPTQGGLGTGLESRRDLDDDRVSGGVSAGPVSGQYVIKPAREGPIPLRLRLARAPGEEWAWSSESRVRPLGILVESNVEGRIYSLKIPVVVRSKLDTFRIILGDQLEDQAGARKLLKLRPVPERQRVPLRLKNPTAAPREVIVELRVGASPDGYGAVVVSPRIAVAGFATVPVAFAPTPSRDGAAAVAPVAGATTGSVAGAGAKSATDAGGSVPLAELEGPLAFRVLDAQRPELVLGQRVVAVEVANPADYARVQDASLSPPRPVASQVNRLSVHLRSVLAPSMPDIPTVLVLRKERIPGLLGVSKGVLRGKLHAGGDLRLTAEGIRLDPALAGDGVIEVAVDGVERALLLKASFVENRDVSIPVLDESVALRLRCPAMARTGSPVSVVLEVDNGPAASTLELSVGRAISGRFEPIETWRYPGTRRTRVGVDVTPDGGGLRFDASLADWSQVLDTGGLRGRFPLRARLRREDGLILREVEQEILLDDQPPRWIDFVGIPRGARRGRLLTVKAIGESPPSGIASAQFFVGKPEPDGKMASGLTPVPGTREPGQSELWKAELKLPADKGASEAAITVRFVTGVGLDAFHTATIELGDTEPVATGAIQGVVREGTLAQDDLLVGLFDAKGKNLGETRTTRTGTFRFNDVIPGIYFITVARPVAATRGQAKAEVKADQTAEVTISLFR